MKFNITPARLAEAKIELRDPDSSNVQAVYSRSYDIVWPGTKTDGVSQEVAARISDQAEEARCSLSLFILANMLGFKQANPDRPFYSRMLVGEAAIRRVGLYRKVCRERFGTFDETALESLVGKPTNGLERRIEASEVVAAGWVIGWKSHHGGKATAAMLAAKELSLDPVWLAIEPAYQAVLEAHRDDRNAASPAIANHRFNATRAMVELKRNKRLALAAFETRQAMIPSALEKALGQLGYSPDQFEIEPVTITDPLGFYEKIGLAIQHLRCLDAAAGEPLKSARLALER